MNIIKEIHTNQYTILYIFWKYTIDLSEEQTKIVENLPL